MAASDKTEYYGLPIFKPKDVPSWLGDFNQAMQNLDAAIHNAVINGGTITDINVVQKTGKSISNVMSQKAVTDELNQKQATLVSGQNIATVNGQDLLGGGNIEIEVGSNVPQYVVGSNQDQPITTSHYDNGANINYKTTDTAGVENDQSVELPLASNYAAGIITASNYQKLDGMADIRNIGEGLEFDGVSNTLKATPQSSYSLPRWVMGNSNTKLITCLASSDQLDLQQQLVRTDTGSLSMSSVSAIPAATTSKAGVMRSSDYTKLSQLPNITSIGDGLTLENGTLSAANIEGGGGTIDPSVLQVIKCVGNGGVRFTADTPFVLATIPNPPEGQHYSYIVELCIEPVTKATTLTTVDELKIKFPGYQPSTYSVLPIRNVNLKVTNVVNHVYDENPDLNITITTPQLYYVRSYMVYRFKDVSTN